MRLSLNDYFAIQYKHDLKKEIHMQQINNKGTTHKHSFRLAAVRALLMFMALALFLLFTQPDALPLAGLLVPFALLYVLVFQLSLLVVTYRTRSKPTPKQLTASAILSILPVLVLVLSSLNQLSRVDIVIVLLFMIGVYVYLQYFNVSLK